MTDKKEYNPEEKFTWSAENAPMLIENDYIQCKDCRFRTDPMVMECKKYVRKPDDVLLGKAPCPRYEKKD